MLDLGPQELLRYGIFCVIMPVPRSICQTTDNNGDILDDTDSATVVCCALTAFQVVLVCLQGAYHATLYDAAHRPLHDPTNQSTLAQLRCSCVLDFQDQYITCTDLGQLIHDGCDLLFLHHSTDCNPTLLL